MFETAADGRIYNTASVIDPRRRIWSRSYRKMFPFRPYETGIEAGTEFCIFDVPGVGRFGLSICYDIWFPETTRQLTSEGVEVLLHPVLTGTTDRDAELAIARATAAQFQCYVFDVNGLGAGGNGRSCVVDPAATVLHQSAGQEDMFPIEVDLSLVRRQRETGIKGLGQVLKSFRDRSVDFPVYDRGSGTDAYLHQLGPAGDAEAGHPRGTEPARHHGDRGAACGAEPACPRQRRFPNPAGHIHDGVETAGGWKTAGMRERATASDLNRTSRKSAASFTATKTRSISSARPTSTCSAWTSGCKNFKYICYIDCYDGRHPNVFCPAEAAACGVPVHRGHQQLPAAAQGGDRLHQAARRQAEIRLPDVRRGDRAPRQGTRRRGLVPQGQAAPRRWTTRSRPCASATRPACPRCPTFWPRSKATSDLREDLRKGRHRPRPGAAIGLWRLRPHHLLHQVRGRLPPPRAARSSARARSRS